MRVIMAKGTLRKEPRVTKVITHGKNSSYTNRGCRCFSCTEAHNIYAKRLRKKKFSARVRFFTLWDHTRRNDGNSDDGSRFVGTVSIYPDLSIVVEAGDYSQSEAMAAFLSQQNGNDETGGYSWVDDTANA